MPVKQTELYRRLMDAWLRGEKLQCRAHGCDGKPLEWSDINTEPGWDFIRQQYRIKPKEPKSFWKLERPSGCQCDGTWDSKDKAAKARDSFYGDNIKVVEYRQVMENE